MQDRALSLDPEQVAALAALDDERSAAPARKSETTASTEIPPTRDRNARLPGGNEDGAETPLARLQVELAPPGRGHLADRTVRATVRTIVASTSRFSPVAVLEVCGRLAQVPQLDLVSRCELHEAGMSCRRLQAVLQIEPLGDAALQQLLPVAWEVTALRDDPDERGVGTEAEGLCDGADDRDALVCLARPLRVEDRDDRVSSVPHDSPAGSFP